MRNLFLFRWLRQIFTRIEPVPNQSYRDLLDNLPEMVCLLSPEGRLISVNRAAENITGYSRAELLEMNISCLVTPEFHHLLLSIHPSQIKPGHEVAPCEIRVLARDGKQVPLEVQQAPVWADGRLAGIQMAGRDLTPQEAIDLVLRKAQESREQAQAARDAFLASMNHQIRTPINGVLGITELALDTDLTPEQREYLLMIKFSADSLLQAVNDILEFAKMQSEKIELEQAVFNLHDSVAQAANALALRADEKCLELTYRIAPEVPEKVVGDPKKLRQVLVQLLENAVKFTEQGEVNLSVEGRSYSRNEVSLQFTVTDTGTGVPTERQGTIFEAFSHNHHGSSSTEGNGLGLAICSRIVEAMGGRIWMESKVGAGCAFHFVLTLGTGPVVQPATACTEGLAETRVLVVDDNSANRRILVEMLKSWGMDPWDASSAEAALDLMKHMHGAGKKFQMALVDAQMPGMDGFDLVPRLQANTSFGGGLIMMLTPLGQRSGAERCRELRIPNYVLKPVHKPELLKTILTVLGQEHDLSAARRAAHQATRASLGHLRILLVEDNLASQFLMVRLLEKMGQQVVVANHGKEALEKLSHGHFDLIFMDVQMPEMDGYEATGAIREQEKENGNHIPIIAMTAHALKGDREHCIAAGMDGYIAKPVSAQEVETILLAFSNPDAVSQSKRPHAWDRAKALERAGGDRHLLRELVDIYKKEKPKLLSQLEQALTEHNPVLLERGAHSLKGVLSYLAAPGASEIARQLEEKGKERDLERAELLVSALQYQLSEMDSVLEETLEATR